MEPELTGRGAILARRIYRLEQHIALCNSLPLAATSETPDDHTLELQRLRAEVEREETHKRVVSLGTEHGCQRVGNIHNNELEMRLSFLKEQFAATILMEEWTETLEPSFASTLGGAYKNVGTGPGEQYRTYRLPIYHPSYEGTLNSCETGPPMSEYGPLENQDNREREMLENICAAMEPHRVGIVLIGLAHLHSMSQKLLGASFNVAAFEWLPTSS